jgi:exodeoxyribonuclease VII large subunit
MSLASDTSLLPEPEGNAKAYSVSELAFALKRTLEDQYGFVRLRGEISKVTRHSSGHVYLTLKDERACLEGVIWKMSVRGLKAQPQQGLEVIVTGRITTYPAGSKYQIVIESMEHAGIGALLAQLERLKAQLKAEGLFDPARKRRIPAHPAVVGVVTSPTGAVIRDILHRIRDRWPCRVVVWPVVVQGERCAGEVAAAVRGFNALPPGAAIPRPDVIIVARGGGSVEDLWPFNDEALARTVAAGTIPLISAVGHETDTTLIDFVSDLRAPTPTGAAELATPVFAELRAGLDLLDRRLSRCGQRSLEDASQRHDFAAGKLKAALERNVAVHDRDLVRVGSRLTPALLVQPMSGKAQRLAGAAERLRGGLGRNLESHARDLDRAAARLTPELLRQPNLRNAERLAQTAQRLDQALQRAHARARQGARLDELQARLGRGFERRLRNAAERVDTLEKLRLSLDPDRPLERGFARVHRESGALAHTGAELKPGEAVTLHFKDSERVAVVDGAPTGKAPKPKPPTLAQQPELF